MPTLRRLLESRHPVVGVVSQPDRGRGRGRRHSPSPVSQVAIDAGVPLLRPERIGEPAAIDALRALEPDLGVVAAFGQFLPKKVRELPTRGYLINAHASLLPRFRGAAPIARAILEGETRSGISVMRIEREMDAGPVALVRETPIDPAENTAELEARLAGLAAEAIPEALEQIASGRIEWREQDAGRATLAPKIEKADARLDWHDSADALARRVRAMAPRPGAYTDIDGAALRVLEAVARAGTAGAAPGTVRRGADSSLRVATGAGWLELRRVQRAGGKPMDIDAFLRGHPVDDGCVLGAPEA